MFISIMVGLIVINIIYGMVPDLSYNKYLKTSIGVIVIVFAVSNIMKIEINDNVFNYNAEDILKENTEYIETVNEQVESEVEMNITNKLVENGIGAEAEVTVSDGDLTEVEIRNYGAEKEKIIKLLSEAYNLTTERIHFTE